MEYPLRDGKRTKARSFKEFQLSDGKVIGVFQGNRGANPDLDILVKYKGAAGAARAPKHIHWVIDLLIKKEHNRELTLEFVRYLRDMWESIKPFTTKEEQRACRLSLTTEDKLSKFSELNEYGEYTVEFIGNLVELLMVMEKTGHAKASAFKGVLDAIIEEKDIFSIVSQATFKGRLK